MLDGMGSDIHVKCIQDARTDFNVMLSDMEHTVFCLVLPGDAQSTRRLSEVFLAGCIPVFVGPPYNSMPLAGHLDWCDIGIIFNISDYSSWMPNEVRQSFPSGKNCRAHGLKTLEPKIRINEYHTLAASLAGL